MLDVRKAYDQLVLLLPDLAKFVEYGKKEVEIKEILARLVTRGATKEQIAQWKEILVILAETEWSTWLKQNIIDKGVRELILKELVKVELSQDRYIKLLNLRLKVSQENVWI